MGTYCYVAVCTLQGRLARRREALRRPQREERAAARLQLVIKGRMRAKPTTGRRRIQMLHDLANDGGSVALKRAAEDRQGWRHRERMSKPAQNLLYSRRLGLLID